MPLFREHHHSTIMRAGLLTLGCAAVLQLATAHGHGIELANSASGSKVLTYHDQTI